MHAACPSTKVLVHSPVPGEALAYFEQQPGFKEGKKFYAFFKGNPYKISLIMNSGMYT
jgi:hypothetical protein